MSDELIKKMDDLGDADARLQMQMRARAAQHAEAIYKVKNAYDSLKIWATEAMSTIIDAMGKASNYVERVAIRMKINVLRDRVRSMEAANRYIDRAKLDGLRAELKELERLLGQVGVAEQKAKERLYAGPTREEAGLPPMGAGGGGEGFTPEKAEKTLYTKLSGQDAQNELKQWQATIAKLGGITKLTSAEMEEYGKVLDTVVLKLQALGKAVPQNLISERMATFSSAPESAAEHRAERPAEDADGPAKRLADPGRERLLDEARRGILQEALPEARGETAAERAAEALADVPAALKRTEDRRGQGRPEARAAAAEGLLELEAHAHLWGCTDDLRERYLRGRGKTLPPPRRWRSCRRVLRHIPRTERRAQSELVERRDVGIRVKDARDLEGVPREL
jgi:hypothetical protein